ncbi:Resolvase, holliday junction-type, YqgF-like [Moorella glycerini]|uniref:Putative pre-16S rRNA nuclease n=1 Tax=Neomoorella stamsii TaxID=1266720 RepID=A0A9X7J411_9FIRM|nr:MULTISPECIES: Holliday junction resolvase RuvX [Moorella]PRR75321.1 putative Holliday junction resolvase [Moorella stamsii]CEP67288.1 Resolvase, holliday junction-type, YqgF-like [Moorella glycerini]
MRIMGLDVGSKTIGVAVSDPLGWTAQGVTTIRRKSKAADVDALKQLVARYGVEEVVVGLPRNMNGTFGPRAEEARAFAARLEAELGLPVHLYDERLTTVAADKILLEADLSRRRRRAVVDQVAASIILQGYLDRRGQNGV